jgi:hypothetical protein
MRADFLAVAQYTKPRRAGGREGAGGQQQSRQGK